MIAPPDAAMVDFAAQIGSADPVSVEGSRTRWASGGELEGDVRLVRAPIGILQYQPEEMTIRARAGTTVRDLHDVLAESGQRTALPDRGGTIGGAIALGENDLCVLGRGTVRSSVLQLRYISADGRIITAGGPTVKNVTGFDLPRLMVGGLGTLGLVGEVILRTNPIPAVSSWMLSSDADPFVALATLHHPSAVLWDGTRTWVELEGHAPDVEAERGVLDGCGSWAVAPGPPALPARRWSRPPAELRSIRAHDPGPFVASVGVGVVYASNPRPTEALASALQRLGAQVKREFDPTGRLNPGRDPARR